MSVRASSSVLSEDEAESEMPDEHEHGRVLVESARDDLDSYFTNEWDTSRSVDYDDIYQQSMARRATRGKVAPRVAEIEQRVRNSQSAQSSPIRLIESGTPANQTPRKEAYGLIQRPELVITNPDRGSTPSS